MFAFYQLARGAGHTVFDSLAFALFNRPLPPPSVPMEQREADYLVLVADLDRRSREKSAINLSVALNSFLII